MAETYAILDVSADCFREIQGKLEAAGYYHAFTAGDDGTLILNLHGLALRDAETDETPDYDRMERADTPQPLPRRS